MPVEITCERCGKVFKAQPFQKNRRKHCSRECRYGTHEERFLKKVDRSGSTADHMDTPCWLWTAHIDRGGYGRFHHQGKWRPAHRVSWLLFRGDIPETSDDGQRIVVMHKCDTNHCVNPDHLEVGTDSKNIKDAYGRGLMTGEGKPDPPQRTKVTDEEIEELRRLYASGEFSQRELADRYGLDSSYVSRIVNYKVRTTCTSS